jgi:hypothetical protein
VSRPPVRVRALVPSAAPDDAILKEGFHAVVRPILVKQTPL